MRFVLCACFSLFSMYENVEAETGEDGVLELWVLVHDDGDNPDVRKESASTTDYVFSEKKK